MKALILVGGYGTRLRPLTFTCPKPLVEFANQPMILHQIEALVKVGVDEIILAVNYQPEVMVRAMKSIESKYKIKITFSIEDEPLGTAGPLALASSILSSEKDEPFFVLNSDVICEFPFESLLAFHKQHGREGTIMATRVQDPSKYGVIVRKKEPHPNASSATSTTTEIEKFVEKPKDFVGDQVNAGIYIFNCKILERIEPVPTSIEKDIFPKMAEEGELHVMDLPGFWADVGQPRDFIVGTQLYLASLAAKQSIALCRPGSATQSPARGLDSTNGVMNDNARANNSIIGNVLIDPSAKLGSKCRIGPNVVIGPNCTIGDGVRLVNCVLMPNATCRDNAFVKDSIVGWHSTVGKWSRLCNTTVLGEDVHVSDEVFINGGSVLPHKNVSSDIMEPKIVM